MKVSREELLKGVETVLPGISTREIIEQSSCVVFKDKKIMTYNDEIACSYDYDLNIEGAVVAMPLVNILRKLKEDFIEVESSEGQLILKGKGRRASVRMAQEILLPVKDVEKPTSWQKLPETFTDGVKLVQSCAGKDDSQFALTCVHIHSDWIEACDNQQASRFSCKTGFASPLLVRRDSLKHIISFDMTEVSETKTWVHFKNPAGLTLSCRRYVEQYPDLTPIVSVSGTQIQLPKGLVEAAEKAEVFSAESTNDNMVAITVDSEKLLIQGEGVAGSYKELKKIQYTGPRLSFRISPSLLRDLIQRHNECEITKDRLKIELGNFKYVSVLHVNETSK